MATFVKTRDIPIAGAHTLPQEFFVSPELFAREREQIFARRWVCIGRESKIANKGDYFLHTIGMESIIVLRDQSGEIRAHYNSCRHRGARMCEAASGSFSETIQCPYHAWTYALDGRLVGAQTSDSIPGFDKKNFHLVSVAIASWEGFLFINQDPNPEPFEEAYASLLGRFERFNLPTLTVARTIEYDVKANWKLVFQNYSECYHCSPVHPQLTKITPSNSGENDLFEGPFLGGYMVMNEQHESLSMSGQACGVPVGDLDEADMKRVYYYSIFPNMLLSLHPDYVMGARHHARRAGSLAHYLRVALSSGQRSRRDVERGGRHRVLGSHQPSGLARLRDQPGGDSVARLSPGTVLEPRESLGDVRPRGPQRDSAATARVAATSIELIY